MRNNTVIVDHRTGSKNRRGELNEVYAENSLLGFLDKQNNIDLVYGIL